MFHLLEFVMTHLYHPETLSFDSFLLNQSREYQLCVMPIIPCVECMVVVSLQMREL